jgi:RHS repeat-associated protein
MTHNIGILRTVRSYFRSGVMGLLILLAIALNSGVACAQGNFQIQSASLSSSSIVTYSNQTPTLTVNISRPVWGENSNVVVQASCATTSCGASFNIAPGENSGTGSFSFNGVGTEVTDTVTITIAGGADTTTIPVTLLPNTPIATFDSHAISSPGSTTVTVSLAAPYLTGGTAIDLQYSGSNPPATGGPCIIPQGSNSGTCTVSTVGSITVPTAVTFTPVLDCGCQFGDPTGAPTTVIVYPPAPPPTGPCPQCQAQGGSPINFTDGNVWIPERDYSLPGLGGGLSLTRTWNSLWSTASRISSEGMFGQGWWSTYEERLWLGQNPVQYYRSDGSIWYFGQDSSSGTFYLFQPAEQHASLAYDSLAGTYTVSYLDGSQKVFNNNGYLIAVLDRNGNQTSVTYDSSNRITQVTDAAGRSITFSYTNASDPALTTSVQDTVGTIATYTYDSSSNLTQVVYADGSSHNYAYSGGVITSVTDGNGKTLETHSYDSSNRGTVSARANGVDALTVYYYASQSAVIDSVGDYTTYRFYTTIGSENYITQISGFGCASCGGRGNQSISYDTSGNVTSRTNPNNVTTTFTYDLYSDVLTKSVALSPSTNVTWSYTYNGFGEVLTATGPAGNSTTNTYDTKGNLLSTETPSPDGVISGSTTSFTYNTKGQLLTISDPLGRVTTMTYTTAGLLASATDAQSDVTSYTYDGRGNRLTATDAMSNTTSYTYDVMNRLTKITYPDSTTTTFAYDSRGRRTSITDQNGKTTSYAYDDADRLTSVTDAASNVTLYAYDTENNLTSVTDAKSQATSFTYDGTGRVTRTTFPSTLSETYSYDAEGNLTSKTDRKSQTINYSYDALDRLTQKSFPDSTAVAYSYDLLGNVTQIVDPTGTYGFTYDHMSRLTGTSTTYSFLSGAFTNSYTYDAASNRTGFTTPDGSTNTYSYDKLNRLTTLANSWAGSFGFSYDALSRRTQITRPNGVTSSYSYDSLSRLLSVLHQLSGSTIDGATYIVDAAGNRTSKTDEYASVTSSYTYDALYELKQVTQSSSTTESYSYDAVGNRTASQGASSYTNNSSNELIATSNASFTYDYNGNTTSKVDSTGTTSYRWDYENRLISVTLPGSGGTDSFKYDQSGRRVQKVFTQGSTTTTTNYAYDGYNPIEETDQTSTVVARYASTRRLDGYLAQSRSGSVTYYQQDRTGSVSSLSSSTGALDATYTYDSFGNATASTGTISNPFRYTNREFDPETGLYYYRARYFDPVAGRFTSEDPVSFDGGLNFYAYLANSPLDAIDPYGLNPQCNLPGGCASKPNPAPVPNPVPNPISNAYDAYQRCMKRTATANVGAAMCAAAQKKFQEAAKNAAENAVNPEGNESSADGSALDGWEILAEGADAWVDSARDCLCENPLAGLDHRFHDIQPGFACKLPWYQDWFLGYYLGD